MLICVLSMHFTEAQNGIKGKVVDAGNVGLPGVNITLMDRNQGTITDDNGMFEITGLKSGVCQVDISFVGFKTVVREVNVTDGVTDMGMITLQEGVLFGDAVVVSASRRREKITDAPATIQIMTSKEIGQYAGNAGELLARQKGVDYFRVGAFGTGFNIRGFNSAFNTKMLQMDDGRVSNLIATGLPFGVLSPLVKEDIERVEVVLGPSAALYGPNAHNGLINTVTKDPRQFQGTTLAVTAGNYNAISGRLRHAQVLSDKFAIKLTGEYSSGKDINWTDSVYFLNKGYSELNPNFDFKSMKGEASVYYNVTKSSDIKVSYGASKSSMLAVTNAGRNQIKDWGIGVLHVKYTSPRFFAQIYNSTSNTDSTFAINRRTTNYLTLKLQGKTEQEALTGSYGGAISPIFVDKSKRINYEGQYNNEWAGFRVILGVQYQKDQADSRQSYLLDKAGPIEIAQTGFYTQIEKPLTDKLKAIFAARADNHDLYGSNFIPKAGLTYKTGNGSWRITYGKGIVSPTILNLSAKLFGGIILGNGEGFTLSDGSKIEGLKVETINTYEIGYKGTVSPKLYLDVNAYYNISENFLSPLIQIATNGRTVTHRGTRPITDFTASGASILTYVNFGQVNTFGADFGISYQLSDKVSTRLNYSYFDFSLDETDLKNDSNKDGKVLTTDLPLNTPTNKFSVAMNYASGKLYGSILARYVEKYDFFSGKNVAAKDDPSLIIGGTPVLVGTRVGTAYNAGPLGGFFLDLNGGVQVSKAFSAGIYVNNILGEGNYEFVCSPPTAFLFGIELKYQFNAFAKK